VIEVDIPTDTISRMLFSAAQEVFTSMVGAELEMSEVGRELVYAPPFDRVVSLVGLTGACVGTGFLSCSGSIACDLASRFLMMESRTVDDEVLDAVGELTNMIVGSTKTLLEERFGPVQMSIPTVVYGKNISLRSLRSDIAVPVRCTYESGDLLVSICLATRELRPASWQ
jgi:chemotaxis protein CheX